MNSFKSIAAAKARLAEIAPEMTLTKTDLNEYRVTFRESAIAAQWPALDRPARLAKMESLAAHESDLESAYDTALAMAKAGLVPGAAETEAAGFTLPETVKLIQYGQSMTQARALYPMAGDGIQAPGALIIRALPDNDIHPFAVHFLNLQSGGYHAGDYCETLAEAESAYASRCRRYDPTGRLNAAWRASGLRFVSESPAT